MGIDTQASIMVGLPRRLIENKKLIDKGLEVCSAYYDGGGDDDAIVGLSYLTTGISEAMVLIWDEAEIKRLKEKFKEITGQTPQVYLTPDVW